MQPDVFPLIGYGSLALLAVYFVFYFRRMRSGPKVQAGLNKLNEAHTEALRENSELLRELIALNRKLLEKQEQRDA